jgi:polyphosphate glucokinase
MSSPAAPVLGLDIGGSGIKGAPVDLAAGALAADRVRLPTPLPATPEAVAGVVAQVLDQLAVAGPVGITLPAVVTGGVVRTAANIDPSWIGRDAVELFTAATGRPVTVVNDADAAGLAEARYGAGAGRSGVVVVVTLGTGIGTAVLADGYLVANTELGHLHLHHGEAEHWAADSVRERENLSWKEWAGRVEDYLKLLHRLLWPDLVILGGGVSKKADKFLHYIDAPMEVVPARMQNEAGIIGAAMLAPTAVDGAGPAAAG